VKDRVTLQITLLQGICFGRGPFQKMECVLQKMECPSICFKWAFRFWNCPPREWSKNWFAVICPPKKTKEI
jgi:hypothetical protein